jgi:hypothetical protein
LSFQERTQITQKLENQPYPNPRLHRADRLNKGRPKARIPKDNVKTKKNQKWQRRK